MLVYLRTKLVRVKVFFFCIAVAVIKDTRVLNLISHSYYNTNQALDCVSLLRLLIYASSFPC